MGTAVQHPLPDWVKPSFVILTLWHSGLSVTVLRWQKLHMMV